MPLDRRPVFWTLSIGTALLAAASTAHVARPIPAAPSRSEPAVLEPAPDLTAVIRDNAPLPVLLTDAPMPVPAEAAPADDDGTRLIEGPVEDVLWGEAQADPVRRAAVAQAVKLFAHRLDVTRDVALGDRVRLLVRRASPDGLGPPAARLDYAEFDGASVRVRLFREEDMGARRGRYLDETGMPLDRFLLRTPLAATRVTSPFGSRTHPLLGYTRLHRGVDFRAAVGTPILAAADGVVAASGRDGGYGLRIVLRHADLVETLYAHLSRAAPSVAAGTFVRQGQVIGWTGQSGAVTGPHLHFEVRSRGVAVDPSRAAPPAPAPDPAEQRVFEARRRAIVERLAVLERQPSSRL